MLQSQHKSRTAPTIFKQTPSGKSEPSWNAKEIAAHLGMTHKAFVMRRLKGWFIEPDFSTGGSGQFYWRRSRVLAWEREQAKKH